MMPSASEHDIWPARSEPDHYYRTAKRERAVGGVQGEDCDDIIITIRQWNNILVLPGEKRDTAAKNASTKSLRQSVRRRSNAVQDICVCVWVFTGEGESLQTESRELFFVECIFLRLECSSVVNGNNKQEGRYLN